MAGCLNDAAWAFIGESGDYYLCDEHYRPDDSAPSGWVQIPDDQ